MEVFAHALFGFFLFLMAIQLLVLVIVIRALKRGHITVLGVKTHRARQPIPFWFFILVFGGGSVACLYAFGDIMGLYE